jgi:amino acid transporter
MQKLKRELSFFDLTNIVIGSIVGADIYIASALTAGMIGPFSIFVWLIAGILATILALIFAYCSYYVPMVGGPFAFVSEAFDDFYGFLTGWSMWIAEVLCLSVFAITFVNYLQPLLSNLFLIELNFFQKVFVKALFIFTLTLINIRGVKIAGRVNDFLTLIKLLPLFLLVFFGLAFLAENPKKFFSNYSPLLPFGFENFGNALILVFWAYVGFEMGTLPASEVKNPKRTIPKAIIVGMLIVTIFYLSTNFVVFGVVNYSELAKTSVPLVLVGSVLLGAIGGIMMSIGALFSVSGSDEAGVLSISRISYAMAIDGLFPKIFSKVHKKYKTPYAALIIQGLIAFLFSIFSEVSGLISFSVFNLAFSFLFVCLALIVLKKRKKKGLYGQDILPWIGITICLYLLYKTSIFDKLIGTSLILLGIPLYVLFSPKVDMHDLKKLFVSEGEILARRLERKERFLANFMEFLYEIYKKIRACSKKFCK